MRKIGDHFPRVMIEQQSGPVDAVGSPLRCHDCCALACVQTKTLPSRQDIRALLTARDSGALKLPGVAGIYVWVLGREQSPWLKVILAKPAPEIERQIPCGCRAVTEIFREIRPLRP